MNNLPSRAALENTHHQAVILGVQRVADKHLTNGTASTRFRYRVGVHIGDTICEGHVRVTRDALVEALTACPDYSAP